MQTFAQSQPANAIQTPAPPATTAPKGPTFTLLGPGGTQQELPVPTTREEVRAIQAQREQLSNQLESVADRRSQLARELSGMAADEAKPGVEARIQLLDQRILQLESDLANTGRQLSMAPPNLVASTEVPSQGGGGDFDDGLMIGGLFTFAFMAIVVFAQRWRWKRRGPRPGAAQLGTDATQRLDRLEHGMDAIAIEIERISEGQRFVTKLLSESGSAATQRAAQPMVLERADPLKG